MSKDSQLQQAVLAELEWEPSVNPAHIGVTANAGVVTLTGHVEDYMQKHAAETAAGRVKGVKAVAEELEVKLPFDVKRGDEAIAAAAGEVLYGVAAILQHAAERATDPGVVVHDEDDGLAGQGHGVRGCRVSGCSTRGRGVWDRGVMDLLHRRRK